MTQTVQLNRFARTCYLCSQLIVYVHLTVVQLEMQLAAREAQLLEKELIYEQVTRLSEHIRTKAENGKEDTLRLAKKVSTDTHTHTELQTCMVIKIEATSLSYCY